MGTSLHLTRACRPDFEFIIHFSREFDSGSAPDAHEQRFRALAALRDAEDMVCDEPTSERAWEDRIKAMMVYLIDYKMVNTDWHGRDYWFNNRLEIDPEVLHHVEALGGEKFFEDCEEIKKEYELAERRDRRDKDELAEQLSLYFVCLRLGFKGKYDDKPLELADYTGHLFRRLPAFAATRSQELFPDAYRHNQEVKLDYRLGMSLTIVLTVFVSILVAFLGTFWLGWNNVTGDIHKAASQVRRGEYFQPSEVEKVEEGD